MSSIFVCEFISVAHGPGDADPLLPQGVAMRDAIVADLLRLPDAAVTCAVGSHPLSAAPVPPADAAEGATLRTASPETGEGVQAFVARVSGQHDAAWIVAPESEGILAHLCDAVERTRWVGCSPAAIRIASSKRATLKTLARRQVPTPLAVQATHRGRWVVKPDDGAGATATRVHADCDAARLDLDARQKAGHNATLEPFVEGEPLSITLLAGPGFLQPLAFNRQRIAIGADGTLVFQGVDVAAIDPARDPRATALSTLALDVARALPGLRGIVGIDLVWDEQRGPVVIEVNPRVTSGYVGLSAALGRNVAGQVMLLHAMPEA